jgi:hypothetical protein
MLTSQHHHHVDPCQTWSRNKTLRCESQDSYPLGAREELLPQPPEVLGLGQQPRRLGAVGNSCRSVRRARRALLIVAVSVLQTRRRAFVRV